MAYHKSNLGAFGENLKADMRGYVPEATDGPWDFEIDHGSESTHNADGTLTEYGEWWRDDGFPEWRSAAVAASKRAQHGLREWQNQHA